jgi:hypothetical protein
MDNDSYEAQQNFASPHIGPFSAFQIIPFLHFKDVNAPSFALMVNRFLV